MIKTLLFSTLFPNAVQPQHGIFVENRLHQLLKTNEVKTRVLAPVPWFPLKAKIFGKYAEAARVPQQEQRNGTDIFHPRYLHIPKYGMNSSPESIFRAALPYAKQLIKSGFDFDLIDAHYFYPDGIAAVMLAQELSKPVVITARGSDLNLIPKYEIPRKKIIWAAKNADALITVCQALKNVLIDMGVQQEKITVLRNGVDLRKFSPPENRGGLREKLRIKNKTLLSVGNLVGLKGHEIIINAMQELPNFTLLIIGDGQERKNLENLIGSLEYKKRIKMLGRVNQSDLKDYYGAADALVLASSREGWANVLLESMACGCPVLATSVGGSPEIINSQSAGLLIKARSKSGIVQSVQELFSNYPSRAEVRLYAEQFSWEETSQGQIGLFRKMKANA